MTSGGRKQRGGHGVRFSPLIANDEVNEPSTQLVFPTSLAAHTHLSQWARLTDRNAPAPDATPEEPAINLARTHVLTTVVETCIKME